MPKEKLWLVKREVYATTLKQAMRGKGSIYCIEESSITPDKAKKVGFTTKKK